MRKRLVPIGDYKVVVLCCTYNQSQYIEDTLNGFSMQHTNFPFVCCVFDDASSDGEQEVLKYWIDKHGRPKDIELYEHPIANIFIFPDKDNPNCIYAICLQKINTWGKPEKDEMIAFWIKQGKYIALCEGDDYWIDPCKLQRQVDFLEQNPNYGLIYSKANIFDQEENLFMHSSIGIKTETFDDLIKFNGIPTLTVCFRKELYQKYCKEISINPLWKMGDYPMWLFISLKTKIKFEEEITAVYRRLLNSASNHSNIDNKLAFLESSSEICSFFLSYGNRWDLKKVYKEKYFGLIISYYISYNLPVKFSSISKYWVWNPKYIFKCILSQLKFTRELMR